MRSISARQFFVAGQIVLGLCLLLCLILVPRYFFSVSQGGVSNYGTESKTVWLFAVGFAVAAMGCLLAAAKLSTRASKHWQLRIMLVLLALLYLGVLFSTFSYKDNEAYRLLHVQAAIALFVWMLISAAWLRFSLVKDVYMRRAFLLLLIGLALSGLTFLGYISILFTAQIFSGVAFGRMMAHALKAQGS